MAYLIIACEIGFWVLVAAGLLARYAFRARRLGLGLLAATPVLDLLLLAAAGIDLRGGGQPDTTHGLAAVYVGVSATYGHKMIRWADAWAAARTGQGPGPVKLHGAAHTAECWRDAGRTAGACLIAIGLLKLLDLAGGVALTQTGPLLRDLSGLLGMVFLIELIWSLSYTIWPKPPAPQPPSPPKAPTAIAN